MKLLLLFSFVYVAGVVIQWSARCVVVQVMHVCYRGSCERGAGRRRRHFLGTSH